MTLSIGIEDRFSRGHLVRLVGRLDASTASKLDTRLDALLTEAYVERLVFDLSGLDYLTTAGIRCFIRARKALEPLSGTVTLVNPQPLVRKTLDIVKAMPRKEIFASTTEFDDYLHEMQERVRHGRAFS